jgi:cytochrome bd ubiquinol oxidase subunit II
VDPNFLQVLWFVLIGVLWVGYFVLEGFDFGVGMLLRAITRDDTERRMVIHSIGPVWDGNEVWLLVAGGATFAAFPGWYASLFSGFYIALFLVLAALIVRGVAFEFWGKHPSRRWRGTWEWATVVSSFLAALLWGVAWANIVHGVAMDSHHDIRVTLWDLLHPYALLGGLTSLSLFLAHGAQFLRLRTSGEVEARATAVATRATPVAAVLLTGFLAWTLANGSSAHGTVRVSMVAAAVLAVALAGLAVLSSARSPGRAFAFSAGAIALWFAALLTTLFPLAIPSTSTAANNLTLVGASSTHYTLSVMTVVAVVFVPLVLVYQAWSYWVFRHRLGRTDFEGTPTPLAVLDHRRAAAKPPDAPEPA